MRHVRIRKETGGTWTGNAVTVTDTGAGDAANLVARIKLTNGNFTTECKMDSGTFVSCEHEAGSRV